MKSIYVKTPKNAVPLRFDPSVEGSKLVCVSAVPLIEGGIAILEVPEDFDPEALDLYKGQVALFGPGSWEYATRRPLSELTGWAQNR